MTQAVAVKFNADELGVNADVALAFLEMATSGRGQEALDRYGSPELRHHNPFFPGDGPALITAMDEDARANPSKRVEVIRAVSEGPWVVLHSRVERGAGHAELAAVHIFRVEDGKILELWDVAQEAPINSPNQYGMF
jgi:predicted SnoaL-like aldol condensation-catalyzing enzyme